MRRQKNSFIKFSINNDFRNIISGLSLFFIGIILKNISLEKWSIIFFIISYVILGYDIVFSAVKNFIHGEFFDENFLMSVATIGAILIGEMPEAVGVMLFFKIGEYFEHQASDQSRKHILSAIDIRPETVVIVKDGEEKIVKADTAKINDIILVKAGDRIPLDGIIVSGSSMMDTSAITGESMPTLFKKGDVIVSGYINSASPVKVKVLKTLENSMVSRILESVENAVAKKPKIDRFLTKFSKIYTPVVVSIAIITAVVPSILFGENFEYFVYTALSFLVISCPCALVLSVPLAFFSGIGRASRDGILFKSGSTLETLAKIKAVVLDKTGTITEGIFSLQTINSFDSALSKDTILEIAASVESASNHPIAKSIVSEAEKKKSKKNKA